MLYLLLASGREVMSTSNGIYVDPTPPVINDVRHVDMAWNDVQPIEFQGQNHTIAVYWEVEDLESNVSQIIEFIALFKKSF